MVWASFLNPSSRFPGDCGKGIGILKLVIGVAFVAALNAGCTSESTNAQQGAGGASTTGGSGGAGADSGPTGGSGGAGGHSGPTGGAAGADGGVDGGYYYSMKCAVCHGTTGAGDGPGGAPLDPKPADFTDVAWQASVTDPYIKQFVVEGGAALGKSAACPPNPDLKDDAALVDALVQHLRNFGP